MFDAVILGVVLSVFVIVLACTFRSRESVDYVKA